MDINMSKFQTILWDFDQTLIDFEKSERYAIIETLRFYGIEVNETMIQRYSEINAFFWRLLEAGKITRNEVFIERFHVMFEEFSIINVDPEAFNEHYLNEISSVYFYLDESYALVEKLKGHFRQYIVTNGSLRTQTRKLELSGFAGLVERTFTSEELGALKPSVTFFERCFEQIPDFKKEQTIIIGDSLTSDMQGGNNASIACCWYNPKHLKNELGIKIDYEIDNLWDIEKLLNHTGTMRWQNQQIKN